MNALVNGGAGGFGAGKAPVQPLRIQASNHRLIDRKKKLCGFAQLRKGVGIDGGSQGINGFLSRQDVQSFLRHPPAMKRGCA